MPSRCRAILLVTFALVPAVASLTVLTVAAQPSTDTPGQTRRAIARATAVAGHKRLPYTSEALTDTWDALSIADADISPPGHILTIYGNASLPGGSCGIGGGCGSAVTWEREHLWPKTYGYDRDVVCNFAYTDLHSIDTRAVEACWALYRCLTLRSDGIAGLPVRLWKGRGEEASEVSAGAAWDLLAQPNPHWSMERLLGMTEWALNTSRRGAFWILDALDGQGRPTEIWWADPRTVRPVRGATTDDPDKWYISHYEVQQPGETGKPKRLDRERVVWFQAPHPFDEFASFPALAAAIESAGLALSSLFANRMLHETGMTGAGYVVPVEGVTWDDDQQAEVAQMFATTVKGQSGWHRVMVASRRDFEVHDLQALSPRDAQFAQLMKLTTEQVCIATGVPLPLIQPTDATFSNVDGSISILWALTLIPRAALIAGTMEAQLIRPHFAAEVDQLDLSTADIPQLQDDAAAKWQLDQSQLGAMLDLADRVARGYDRDAALKAAVFYVGCPDDVAEVIIPASRLAEDGDTVDAAKVSRLPPLSDMRQLISAVMTGDLPRASAVAILEVATGDRAVAEAIVADAGTRAIETAPASEIAEARAIVTGVTFGQIPRASAIALLARLFGDQAAAAAVVADARPMLAPVEDAGASEDVGDSSGASTSGTPSLPAPAPVGALPPPSIGRVIRFQDGQGYRVVAHARGATSDLLSLSADLGGSDDHEDRLAEADDIRVYGSDAHARTWQAEVDKLEERTGPIREVVASLFNGQAREMKRGLEGLSDDAIAGIVSRIGIDLAEPSAVDLEALRTALSEAVLGRGFGARWIERGMATMQGGLTDLAEGVGAETCAALGVDAALDLGQASPMARALLARAGRFAESTTATSWLRVGEVLARGVQQGESIRDLAKRVAALGEEWKGSRAEMVAWTETHSAAMEVARESVRESGVAARRTWLSALDDRVRDDHRDAHGQTVGIDEEYTVGGESCEGPGSCGEPEQDINCRCVEVWEVDD